jgi:glutathione synthase
VNIAFLVNDPRTELAVYSTTRLGMTALQRGHSVWVFSVGDFSYESDQQITAQARAVPAGKYADGEAYLRALNEPSVPAERIRMAEMDVVMLRNDPAVDAGPRPWAQQAGLVFGRRATRHGVIVLNDPDGLSRALNKMYFQDFPNEVRPRTVITRSNSVIRDFARAENAPIVIKPLTGSGGQSVFLVRPEDMPNLNQMIEAVARDGYVVAQEYLPAAAKGDTRMFLMNGVPLQRDGHYAAFRRVRRGDDMRSNVTAGGTTARAKVTREMLHIAEVIRPKLVMDGMFLVGLDIVGDKLMEVNVFSPGGLGVAERFEGVDFCETVLESLERKVEYARNYRRSSDNMVIATL